MTATADLRCVVVVHETLPPGLAANAAGVLALTLGATLSDLTGTDAIDVDTHPGLIAQGVAVLAAPSHALSTLRHKARSAGLGVIDFPAPDDRPPTGVWPLWPG